MHQMSCLFMVLSPLHLHMTVRASLTEAHEHLLVLKGVEEQQPHFTEFKTSSGAAEIPDGSHTGARTLFSSSLIQP